MNLMQILVLFASLNIVAMKCGAAGEQGAVDIVRSIEEARASETEPTARDIYLERRYVAEEPYIERAPGVDIVKTIEVGEEPEDKPLQSSVLSETGLTP